jgi:hypothetical protein
MLATVETIMRKHLAIEDLGVKPFVFLGGTINSFWRNDLIPNLKCAFFNPVVPNWTPEHAVEENLKKSIAAINLFVITPEQLGMYSIAEMTYLAVKQKQTPQTTLIAFIEHGAVQYTEDQRKSNQAIKELLADCSDTVFVDTLEEVASYLNSHLPNEME